MQYSNSLNIMGLIAMPLLTEKVIWFQYRHPKPKDSFQTKLSLVFIIGEQRNCVPPSSSCIFGPNGDK